MRPILALKPLSQRRHNIMMMSSCDPGGICCFLEALFAIAFDVLVASKCPTLGIYLAFLYAGRSWARTSQCGDIKRHSMNIHFNSRHIAVHTNLPVAPSDYKRLFILQHSPHRLFIGCEGKPADTCWLGTNLNNSDINFF